MRILTTSSEDLYPITNIGIASKKNSIFTESWTILRVTFFWSLGFKKEGCWIRWIKCTFLFQLNIHSLLLLMFAEELPSLRHLKFGDENQSPTLLHITDIKSLFQKRILYKFIILTFKY